MEEKGKKEKSSSDTGLRASADIIEVHPSYHPTLIVGLPPSVFGSEGRS